MTYDLPLKALRKLHLDERTEVFWSEEQQRFLSGVDEIRDLIFLGVGLITVSYATKVEESSHYLNRNDPYYVVRGACKSVEMEGNVPEEATHYVFGPTISHNSVSYGKNKRGTALDRVPIVFLRKSK